MGFSNSNFKAFFLLLARFLLRFETIVGSLHPSRQQKIKKNWNVALRLNSILSAKS